jgi:hypothetical protein
VLLAHPLVVHQHLSLLGRRRSVVIISLAFCLTV